MARDKLASPEPPSQARSQAPQPSIDHVFEGLLDHPSVESAIVLSRKDGSIIRASGFNGVEQGRARAARQTAAGEAAEQAGLGTSSDQTGAEAVSQSPAEALAVSILQCVQAADSLGSVLAAVSSSSSSLSASSGGQSSLSASSGGPSSSLSASAGGQSEDPATAAAVAVRHAAGPAADALNSSDAGQTSASDESAVQLLRLRVSNQREVIIYPDSRYLSCVVQHVGREAGWTRR